MNLDAVIWVLLPVFVAAGSALLSFFIMQARMEVALAKERENLAEANAMLNSNKVTLEERVRAAEESTRRKALDDFMQEFRVEERHYFRENKSANAQTKSMILQERLYFRNLPLSNWIEHEMVVEDSSSDARQMAQGRSVFNPGALVEPSSPARLLQRTPSPVTAIS